MEEANHQGNSWAHLQYEYAHILDEVELLEPNPTRPVQWPQLLFPHHLSIMNTPHVLAPSPFASPLVLDLLKHTPYLSFSKKNKNEGGRKSGQQWMDSRVK
mmetsp:Transcript_16199/g.26694  ORF Transcript_16199/g.26694 Transcript_16199/m.26694 type:complete len:101 (-) Transcript_16199:106-408(-)